MTMIEKVAEALIKSFKERVSIHANIPFEKTGVTIPGKEIWIDYAKAAIQAMREPTEEMMNASPRVLRSEYQNMIDAALKE